MRKRMSSYGFYYGINTWWKIQMLASKSRGECTLVW
jgi:hypothetical protein